MVDLMSAPLSCWPGDEAEKIAKMAIVLADYEPPRTHYYELESMAKHVRQESMCSSWLRAATCGTPVKKKRPPPFVSPATTKAQSWLALE